VTPDEHRLPADVNRWPKDPKTLLGVQSDFSRRDLKLAYTRLIKQYKPEHAPEEFRLLRAAYDELERELEWRDRFRQWQSAESSDAADEIPRMTITIRESGGNANETDERSATSHQGGVSLEESADHWWQSALDGGELTIAYAKLRDQSSRPGASEIDYARLYWLLTLASHLEPDRDPCAWLIEGLQRTGFDPRLVQILTTEVRRRGGMVPLVLEEGLLEGLPDSHSVIDLMEVRWFAARQQGRFDVIGSDFQSFHQRYLDEPDLWLRLLSRGLHQVILSPAVATATLFREEIARIPYRSSQDWIWDSVEADLALHQSWSETRSRFTMIYNFVQPMLELIEATWELPSAAAYPVVLIFAEPMQQNPHWALDKLVQVEKVARPLLQRLLDLFEQQLSELNFETLSEVTPELDEELQRFVDQTFSQSEQSNFISTVLDFCLFEAVTTHDIAAAIHRMNAYVPDEYYATAELLTTNLSLNCVVQANRLFW
jgi:hypothetical protein